MVLRKKTEGGKVLRKKKKPEDEGDDGATVRSMKKKKKNVAEIDGVLWALDDDGNPTKKLRKKKKPGEEDDGEGDDNATTASGRGGKKGRPRRAKSETALDDASTKRTRGRPVAAGQKISRRAKSLGRDQAEQEVEKPRRRAMSAPGKARTYIDPKGRKVVIDEGGNKTVFDKNGKRLRKKGEKDKEAAPPPEPKPPAPLESDDDGTADDFLSGLGDGGDERRESNIFDSLWDDEMTKAHGAQKGPQLTVSDAVASVQRETEANTSLSSKISEVGKENKELQLQLSVAEEAIENLTEQNKKEKSKNVKAMTEVMQLKADFTEASSELQKLRAKVKDMQQTIDQKDRELESLGGAAGGYREEKKNDGPCESCETLKEEITILNETIAADKSTFEKDIKQKDERINFLTIELDTIKKELEEMINGDKGGPSNPTMVRLLQEKKSLETKYNQEKEVTGIRIEGMQEMIASLEKVNTDLKKQLTSGGGGGGGGGDDDASQDGSIDMNYLAGGASDTKKSRPGARKKGGAAKTPATDLNASISDMFSGLMSRK